MTQFGFIICETSTPLSKKSISPVSNEGVLLTMKLPDPIPAFPPICDHKSKCLPVIAGSSGLGWVLSHDINVMNDSVSNNAKKLIFLMFKKFY